MPAADEFNWSAKWITYNAEAYSKTMPVFRRALNLNKPVRRATLHICGWS